MPYTPQTWVDGSGGGTSITAARLNYMEAGIDNVDTEAVHTTGAETVAGVKTLTSQPVLTAGMHARSTATTAPLGAELLTNGSLAADASGWTVGAGWAWSGGALVHTAGSTATIAQNIAVTSGDRVQITWNQPTGTAGSLVLSVGAVSAPVLQYYDQKAVLITVGATGSLSLAVTPSSDYAGSLNTFTAKKIVGDSVAALVLADSAGAAQGELRASGGNVGVALLAQRSLTTGNSNTGIGHQSQQALTTGSSNTGVGFQSQYSLTTGGNNIGIGYQSQYSVTTGSSNTGIGYQAQFSLTTGNYSTGIGLQAQRSVTTGSSNVGIGYQAQQSLTTGSNNTATGLHAQQALTTGNDNTGVGFQSQYSLTTGSNNIGIGYQSQYSVTTGNSNTATGYQAQFSLTTGINNTTIGLQAASTDGTTATVATVSNTTTLGYQAQALADNVCVIGSIPNRQSLCLGNYGDQLGGGRGVFALSNAQTLPATNPTGGGVLYAEAGALKWRGSSGTVTTLAAA